MLHFIAGMLYVTNPRFQVCSLMPFTIKQAILAFGIIHHLYIAVSELEPKRGGKGVVVSGGGASAGRMVRVSGGYL